MAKVQGVVDRIEVIYHGEKEDMSDSLRKIADQSDRELSARMKAVGKKPLTGGINEDLRVNEDSLAFESMAIRFYITTEVKAGLGDWRGVIYESSTVLLVSNNEVEFSLIAGKSR